MRKSYFLFILATLINSVYAHASQTYDHGLEMINQKLKSNIIVPQNIHDENLYKTVRIETESGTGTGVIVQYCTHDKETIFLVTNKHVIRPSNKPKSVKRKIEDDVPSSKVVSPDGFMNLYFHLSEATYIHRLSKPEQYPIKENCLLSFNSGFRDLWQDDENGLDLSFFDLTDLFVNINRKLQTYGTPRQLYYKSVVYNPARSVNNSSSYLPDDSPLKNISNQRMKMIGYPQGLWDERNNYPLSRVGDPASHPNIDFNNVKEFLLNIPMVKGSSGSAVFNEDGQCFLGMIRAGERARHLDHTLKMFNRRLTQNEAKLKQANDRLEIMQNKVDDLEEESRKKSSQEEEEEELEEEEDKEEELKNVFNNPDEFLGSISNFINLGYVIKAEEIFKSLSRINRFSNSTTTDMLNCIGGCMYIDTMEDLIKLGINGKTSSKVYCGAKVKI